MNNPKYMVSIRCMTYNHASYIEDAMNGFCMQQTTFPFVAIIVDDASTDGEPDVINAYLKEHFKMDQAICWETDDAHFIYVRHLDNQNCDFVIILLKYNFRQTKKSKTSLYADFERDVKYIALCEGDDYWIDTQKLAKQVSFLDNHNDYVVCCHDFKVLWEEEKRFQPLSFYNNERLPMIITLDNFFAGDYTQPLTCLFRNNNFIEREMAQKYRFYRDRVFFYYVLKKGKCWLMNDLMGVYRKHSGGTLSGTHPINNYYIYMSIGLQINSIEKDKRALTLYKRHGRGLLCYRWNNSQKSHIFEDLGYMFKNGPTFTTICLVSVFLRDLLVNKIRSLLPTNTNCL